MATKQEWIDYSDIVSQYAKDLKKWVKELPEEGQVATANDGPGSNPPTPPPPPPPNP